MTQPQLDTFLQDVADRAPDLTSNKARIRAIEAVLGELARYVAGPAAQRLAASLPEELRGLLNDASGQAAGGQSGDLIASVATREQIAFDSASAQVQAVLRAVAQAADATALRGVREQLTPELRRLLDQEEEGDTSHLMSAGPVEPSAPKQAGPDRPVAPEDR